MKIFEFAIAYFCVIGIISVAVTAYDKFAAKHLPAHRTRESTMLLLSALGGALGMYLTMIIIRHKTKHKKFMISLPIMIIIQFALIAIAYVYLVF